MKKYLTLTLGLAVLLMLVACQTDTPANGPVGETGSQIEMAEGDLPGADFNRSDYFITVLTGPTSGIFFPIGGGFFQVADAAGYHSNVTATGATVANINALLTNQGEIAIAMTDAATQAVEATYVFEGETPADQLRGIMGLWPNVVQIVTTENSGIRTFEDLRGRRVGVGAPGSGVEVNAQMMFAAHGMTYDDANVDFLSYSEAIDQMRNGLIDAAFVTSGLGNATILELAIDFELSFIPIDGEARQQLIENHPVFIEYIIPADVYGTTGDTESVAVMNALITTEDLPSHVVYDLLTLFFSDAGLTTLHGTHATAAQHLSLETALRGVDNISLPLHEGAIAFFRSRGLME
ncbi:MAG: TAXI family TRAP transporter solute-binding subunit [Defluviitaleaceae bacterium]|nr:TAXI family TRAP transporter solute-binding subunit [Defluviitaleaceae bacterium]